MLDPKQYKISDYLNNDIACECGKRHFVPIKNIFIEENAMVFIPALFHSNDFHKAFILCDQTTYSIAGTKVEEELKKEACRFTSYIINSAEPTPDERTLGEVLINFDTSCDLIIAVGSGTINDLSRYLSFKLGLPYMIVATAPSMDGFASNVAPLIVNHMKTTYEAHIPFAIIGDTNIIKEAPMTMIAAGIGDILGKYNCLCDWKIAHLMTGEYHCQAIEAIVNESIQTVVTNIDRVKQRDPGAIKNIMEALVLSGIAMSFAGNSRPASGSEHHISHYWEMMYLFAGKPPVLHGTKVGIGTVAVLKAYELLIKKQIDFEEAERSAANYNQEAWEANIRLTYQDASAAVIALESEVHKNAPANVIPRIKKLNCKWPELVSIVKQLPSADEIRNYLTSLGAADSPMVVGIDKATFLNSFLVAKELRNRFGLLQILFDLGLTKEISEQVWEYFNA